MRIYNRWAGNEQGTQEDVTRCIAAVGVGGRSPLSHQCYRKRGYGLDGLYCSQHAGMLAQGVHVRVGREATP